MRKLLLALAFCVAAWPAWAQCNGVFAAGTTCGNGGTVPALPSASSTIGGSVISAPNPPGTFQIKVGGTNQLDYGITNNGGWTANNSGNGFFSPYYTASGASGSEPGLYVRLNTDTASNNRIVLSMDSNNDVATLFLGPGGSSGSHGPDLWISREVAGVQAFTQGVTGAHATGLHIYNNSDVTSGPPTTSYERGVFDWTTTTNVLTIGTQKGGTGATRNLQFVIGNATVLDYGITEAGNWVFANGSDVVCNGCQFASIGNRFLVNNGGNTQNLAALGQTGVALSTALLVAWSSTTNVTSIDTALARNAVGVVEANNGTAGTLRELKSRSYVIGGTPPTTTSSTCGTLGTQAGGNTAGTIVVTCTAQNLVLNFGFTAPTGWACDAEDRSTPADNVRQTASSATSATFASVTTATNDTVQFKCLAY